ncbi:hypothetical protein [Paenibacillus sp. FJAT-26967]|uniref:hypothetical protein n=1 Tax=Paenibacillus sp. FJAT-26967 TaxID=1729690 RepID=UPI00083998CF|nr:hypothetical protein [Paenibacillus sp. FJAT-26967]
MEYVKKPYTGPIYNAPTTQPQVISPAPMPKPLATAPMPQQWAPAPMPQQWAPAPVPTPLPAPVIQSTHVYVSSHKPHCPPPVPSCYPVKHKPVCKKGDNSASILVLFILLVIITRSFGGYKKC